MIKCSLFIVNQYWVDVPTIYETVGENKLNLSIVGVRAYNQMNLYNKKVPELFRLAIGFKTKSVAICASLPMVIKTI